MKIAFINACDKPSLPSRSPITLTAHTLNMSILSWSMCYFLFLKPYVLLKKVDGVLYVCCLCILFV